MELSEDDKALVRGCLDRGEPLPERFRWLLFKEPRETELIWPGKTSEVTTAVLPFQCIEQIDEPRAETSGDAYGEGDLFAPGGRQNGGWSNKLIWGDNKLILSSLKGGPLRRQIEAAGGLKLVYIDPPFDVGADFSFTVPVGDSDQITRDSNVLEDVAYRDTWGRGIDSYLAMISERLRLIHDILAPDGSIVVHVGPTIGYSVRNILEEIFGRENYVNEIIWRRSFSHNDPGQCGVIHDNLYYFQKSSDRTWNKILQAPSAEYVEQFFDQYDDVRKERYARHPLDAPRHGDGGNLVYEWKGAWPARNRTWSCVREKMEALDAAGKIHYPKNGIPRLKKYESEYEGTPIQDIWMDINKIHNQSGELVDYATQKPQSLLDRVIKMASNPGDLVADFFCGSGTTLAVAEKLGRKWIGADLGRFAIHTSRKRLIGVQRELKAQNKPYRSFEILNLGKYERQWFIGVDPTLPEAERQVASAAKEARYLALMLEAYRAEPVEQSPPFHGRKGAAWVLVGPVDAPVTEATVTEAVEAARALGVGQVDVLGFEFEMGLAPRLVDEARAKGVAVALRYIPKDVFDRRAVEKGQVSFHDLAYVEAKASVADRKARKVSVSLENFGVSYRQDDVEALVVAMKPGASKVTVDQGQVVKVSKAKSGEVTREVLTKSWTDWIDYWAVDFDYTSRSETEYVTTTQADGSVRHAPQWTGRYIFENEWQEFRTRQKRSLGLTSVEHAYDRPGRKQIAIKVIDIFGNDTTKVIGVEV